MSTQLRNELGTWWWRTSWRSGPWLLPP